MPKVGEKHFSYDKAGYAAAKKEAAQTGKKVNYGKKKKKSAAHDAAYQKIMGR